MSKDAREVFRELYNTTSVISAQIRPSKQSSVYLAYLTLLQPHIERKAKVKTQRTLVLDDNSPEPISSTITELVDVVDQAVNVQGTHQAIQRAIEDKGKGTKTFYIDIYDLRDGQRTHSINVTGKHGAFCADPTFGRLRWSPTGKTLAYTADRRKQVDDDDISVFDKHRYVPTWGEQFSPSLQQPRVYYPEPKELTDQLSEHSLGQPQFESDGKIIFTAYENTPDGRRLGIIYCQNRLSGIYALDVETQQLTLLSNPKRAVRSPRCVQFQNGKSVVVYLSNEAYGPHGSNCRIESVTTAGEPYGAGWATIDKQNLKDPGLYIDQLPYEPFIKNDAQHESLIVTSNIESRKAILEFDLITDEVRDISKQVAADADKSSLDCFGAFGERIIMSQSTFNKAQQVVVYNGTSKVLPRNKSDLFRQLESLRVEYDERTKSWVLQSVLASNKPTRGIILPHGGPHAAMTPAFSAAIATFALSMNITVVMPNYRGSTGFGEDYLKELLGNVGTYDVEDCIAAMDMTEKEYAVEKDNWCVYGGSHGGFLAAHLTAQYPTRFKTAIVRNPVISLATNSTQSDIPDWCFVESGIPFDPSLQAPTATQYGKMDDVSPLKLAQNVQAATLLLAGADDQRVPNQQTRHWYHALRNHQKDVDMLVFKGTGHPLDSVEAETTGFEVTLQWFEKYFK
ncbi:alpha/beta-hydrolase [Wallemia mellicola]|uniref:Dipeptidyl-peptidase V n=1 Tax=Wallemia mellicola TaxID=1708541 RepID=A0AB74KNH8_9BASI|nr:alpha/beta-hydrolase [Wallemia mellicola]TIC71743.1 alpha/beta-hydrolase [Wallemia mellicola]